MAFSVPNLRSIASSLGVSRASQRALNGSRLDASSSVTADIAGFDQLHAQLEQLPDNLAKREMLRAGRDAGEIVRAKAAALAPFNPEVPLGHPAWRTMRLREGIRKTVRTKANGAAGFNLMIAIGVDKKHAFFGRFVEKGFAHIGGKLIPAKLFIRSAAENLRARSLELFGSALSEGVRNRLSKLRK